MKIALDAMGGDYAPAVTIEGAIETVDDFQDIDITLVVDETSIRRELNSKRYLPNRISIKHASQIVGMDESPAVAIRKKRDSTISKAIELVKNGEADGFVSAGHSGAVMATAFLKLGTLNGV